MAVIIYRLGLIISGLFALLGLFLIARKIRLRWWPAFVLRLILLIGLLLVIFSPQSNLLTANIPNQQVIVLDNSSSVNPQSVENMKMFARDWELSKPGRMVILATSFDENLFNSKVETISQDQAGTDFQQALQHVEKVLQKNPGRILLVSDGQVTENENIEKTIVNLQQQGHEISLLRMESRNVDNDRVIGEINIPKYQWAGTPFEIQVPIFNHIKDDENQLFVQINNEFINVEMKEINSNLFSLRIPAQPEGICTLKVFLNAEDDPDLNNNISFGNVVVLSVPKILMVSKNPELANNFLKLFPNFGENTKIISPLTFPLEVNDLQEYKVIIIHNLLAADLNQEIMKAIKVFVKDLGGGLIFLGGNNSFTLGDYKNTLIEPLLPVKLEPPPRNTKSPLVYMLILDRSASMSKIPDYDKDLNLLDIAREAAMRSLERIGSEDYLGVITYGSDVTWEVPLEVVGEGIQLRRAMDIVSSISYYGQTSMYLALSTGVQSILELSKEVTYSKNILLLTDGRSSDGSTLEFEELALQAKQAEINISTIGLGEDVDELLLCKISEITGGRCYMVASEMELPKIMVAESEAIRSENIQNGETTLIPAYDKHPILSGLRLNNLPHLNAYNALTSKVDEGTEDILVSANFGDPILSVWQYGLGRVVTWMGDIGEVWTMPWNDPVEESLFWSQIVKYTLVNPAINPIQAEVNSQKGELEISVRMEDVYGTPMNFSAVYFLIPEENGKMHKFQIPQSSPGEYDLLLPEFAPGNYLGGIEYKDSTGSANSIDLPFTVNNKIDDIPIDPMEGNATIESWIEVGVKEIYSLEEFSGDPIENHANQKKNNGAKWLLLLGLIIYWPLEIALRRQWLPWSG